MKLLDATDGGILPYFLIDTPWYYIINGLLHEKLGYNPIPLEYVMVEIPARKHPLFRVVDYADCKSYSPPIYGNLIINNQNLNELFNLNDLSYFIYDPSSKKITHTELTDVNNILRPTMNWVLTLITEETDHIYAIANTEVESGNTASYLVRINKLTKSFDVTLLDNYSRYATYLKEESGKFYFYLLQSNSIPQTTATLSGRIFEVDKLTFVKKMISARNVDTYIRGGKSIVIRDRVYSLTKYNSNVFLRSAVIDDTAHAATSTLIPELENPTQSYNAQQGYDLLLLEESADADYIGLVLYRKGSDSTVPHFEKEAWGVYVFKRTGESNSETVELLQFIRAPLEGYVFRNGTLTVGTTSEIITLNWNNASYQFDQSAVISTAGLECFGFDLDNSFWHIDATGLHTNKYNQAENVSVAFQNVPLVYDGLPFEATVELNVKNYIGLEIATKCVLFIIGNATFDNGLKEKEVTVQKGTTLEKITITGPGKINISLDKII